METNIKFLSRMAKSCQLIQHKIIYEELGEENMNFDTEANKG